MRIHAHAPDEGAGMVTVARPRTVAPSQVMRGLASQGDGRA
jgi:hypothetical protein